MVEKTEALILQVSPFFPQDQRFQKIVQSLVKSARYTCPTSEIVWIKCLRTIPCHAEDSPFLKQILTVLAHYYQKPSFSYSLWTSLRDASSLSLKSQALCAYVDAYQQDFVHKKGQKNIVRIVCGIWGHSMNCKWGLSFWENVVLPLCYRLHWVSALEVQENECWELIVANVPRKYLQSTLLDGRFMNLITKHGTQEEALQTL